MNLFNEDGIWGRTFNFLGQLIALNLLWMVCSIPVITVGTSTTALYYCILKLKKDGANKVYFIATFSLFTEGVQKFDSAYQNQYFDKLYTTNLSYVPEEYREKEWFHTVDCSEDIAEVINALHNREPLKSIDDGKRKILTLRKEKGL